MSAFENLTDIVNSSNYSNMVDELNTIKTEIGEDHRCYPHVKALTDIMPRLSRIVADMQPVPVPDSEQAL